MSAEQSALMAILTAPWPGDAEAAELVARDQQKLFATCQARAALRGIVLVQSHDDRGRPEWIASLHAMCKAFSSLDDLERWLDRVEGKQR